MEDKLLGLYNDFKEAGLFKDTKDFNTFKKRMQGTGYQSQIYKVAQQNGADVGQFWQFQKNFGLGRFANKGGAAQVSKPTAQTSQQSELIQAANRVAQDYNARKNSEAYKAGQGMWGAKRGVRSNGKDWRQNHPTVAKIYDGIGDVAEGIGNYFSDGYKNSVGAKNERVKEIKNFMPNMRKSAAEANKRFADSGLSALTKKDSEMNPLERSQASQLRKGMQRGVAESTSEENRRMNNPITSSRVGKDTAPTSNELLMQLGSDQARQARIKQQHMDDAAQLAYQGVGQNLGNDIFNEVDKGIEEGKRNSIDFMSGAISDREKMLAMQNEQIAGSVFKAAQGQNSTEAIQKIVGDSVMNKVSDYFSRPNVQKNIMDSAAKMNMAPELYLQEYVMPGLMQYAKDAVSHRKLENEIPKSFWEYLAKNASNSILGMMVQLGSQTKENRQLRQQGLAVAEGAEEMPQMVGHKNADHYHVGIGSRFVGSAANMLLDSGPLGMLGAGADAAVSAGARIITRGLAKAGIKDVAKLTAREAAFKAANMTMAQKITSGLMKQVPRSALNLGGYSGITAALGQASTGEDTSLAAVASAGWEGFKHGAATGSLFGLTGSVTRPWAQRYGINGLERTAEQRRIHAAQKIGAEAASLGAEAGTMMVADNLTSDKEMSMAQFLEDGVMVLSFKLGEPNTYKHLGSALHNLTHDTSKSPITLTKDERNELMNSTSGKNLMDAFTTISKGNLNVPGNPMYRKTAYNNFMNDPEVSRTTKEKINAALGVPSQTFKLSQRSVNDVKNKQILEYASDGTLISRTSYKNAEQRRDILFRQKTQRDNMHVLNLLGYGKLKNREYLDDNDHITPLAAKFLNSKGYDLSKEPTEAKNAQLITDMRDEKSVLHNEWIRYADSNMESLGLTDEIKKILAKEPLRRTDEEVAKIKEYRNALETQLFPDGKPNTEQAEIQGRSIAEDNNLGSEKPNPEVVVNTLNYLKQAENDLSSAYDDSDNFHEGLLGLAEQLGVKPQGTDLKSVLNAIQSTGMTNPQIFGMLADSSGKFMVNEAELEPFSRYMMALSRAQGMQKATAEAIDENVKNYVQQWSFHGTMDGNPIDGDTVIEIQDNTGRTLLVGSGDVSYDPTNGKPKEGVGDMLVCLDPRTGEPVYLNVADTTLYRVSTSADLEAYRRQQLQQVNSAPYNQAAQEQAMVDAANPQPKEEETPVEQTQQGNIEIPQQNYTLSEKKAGNGEQFYQDDSGNIDLANIPDEVFDSIGYTKAPFRLTPSMIRHMLDRHNKELKFKDENEAIHFVRDVMTNFDHVRLGTDGALVFSIENGRNRTGKRAITILINSDNGQFYGLKTSGYEGIKGLERRPLLWERGANKESSSTDAASAIVPTSKSSVSGEQSGSASNQSIGLGGKDTNNSLNNNGVNTTLTFKDGTPVPVDANGEPDFMNMTPEQGAELYNDSFNDPDAQVAKDVKAAEKALKDAKKMEPKGKTFTEKKKSQQVINETIKKAEEQLRVVKDIQKTMTAKKVAETIGKPEGESLQNTEGMDEATKNFVEAPKVEGRKGTITLPNGEEISGTYYAVPAMSLIPSHDPFDGYKPHAGVPLDENGHTINDRDYYNDKSAQDTTNAAGNDYDGRAISDVPVVNPDGRVLSGNGRTMAGQIAAANGKDAKYVESRDKNAEGFGMKAEDLDKLDHARVIFVPDEPLPYTTETFAKFNRNEKKTQSNTEQAVTKAKSLSAGEVGAIVADIEGNGSLEAFFNNPNAINSLIKTLQEKGIIGQNDVAELMEGTDKLSPQGKEMVKNLLLGSIFKPETIRMLGVDSAIKNKAVAGIRAVMDNLKLGDYSLRDEIDQAIQLLYEARTGGNKVDTLLRTPEMFKESAADRYHSISQMMALALEGKASDFRDLLNEYNHEASARNTGEGDVFGNTPTEEELIRDFLNYKEWKDYETRRNSETERGNDAESVRETEPEAQERNDEWYNLSSAKLDTVKGEERKQILHQMGEYVKDYAKKSGFDEPVVYDTWEDFEKDFPGAKEELTGGTNKETMLGGFSDGEKMYFVMEDKGVADINDVKDTFNHEATHVDNQNDPSRKEAIIASVKDFKTVKLTDLMNAIEYISNTKRYTEMANDMLAKGKDPTELLAEEFLANAVEEIYRKGEDAVSEITSNPTLQKLALDAYKFRENDRRGKERPSESGDTANRKMEESTLQDSEKTSRADVQADESKQESQREGSDGHGGENAEGRGVKSEAEKDTTNPVKSIEDAAASYRQAKIDKAAEAYKAAKESGDEEQITKAAKTLKHLMDDNLKEQGYSLKKRQALIGMIVGKKEAEIIDKPLNEMDSEEREFTASKNPLTESEIRELTPAEDKNFIEDAVDYINGNHGPIQTLAYLKIWKDVRSRYENAPDNSGAKDGTQLAPSDNGSGEGLGLGTGRDSGGPAGQVDRGTGNEPSSGERGSGESGENDTHLPAGEQGYKQGEGDSSRMGDVSSRSAESNGGSGTGEDGNVPERGGRESSGRPAAKNAKRKPTAKQGTTWRGRTGEEIKKNVEEKKAAALAAIAKLKSLKYDKNGSGYAGSMAMFNPRQMEELPTVADTIKDYGMAIIDQGIYKVKDWLNNIRDTFMDALVDTGFTETEADRFIKEMWNSKMEMDGETHTIADWCSIYEKSTFRKKLNEKLDEKRQKQMDAEPIKVKVGDRKNIEETLPYLLPQQQEDVYKAETQFFGKEHADREHAYGKGYMFTNGTGTGKTYTGLGIAKRLVKQGKGRILFVTPSQKKVSDWIEDGKNLGLDIRDLDAWAKERGTTATTESGEGCVITTFANFGLNKKLLETEWDAVIYDESHRIMENKNGKETARSMQHYKVTNRDEGHCFLRLQDTNPHYQKMQDAADKFAKERAKEMKRITNEYKKAHPSAKDKDVDNATYKMMPKDINRFTPADAQTFPKLGKLYNDFKEAQTYYYNEVKPKLEKQAKDTWKNTKTIFLSATPFNTRENLDYAEGYIFKYPKDDGTKMSGRTRFYLDHFGAAYKFRYNRLEQSISNPEAVAKQEVAFSDYLQNNLGTMSGRIIDSPYDYSRDFPTVAPDHADDFNNAVQECLHTRHLYSAYLKTIGDYNYGSALFETMKVANSINRIKEHLAAGRKVVIYHRRVESKEAIRPPFEYMLDVANRMISQMRPGKEKDEFIAEANEFREKHQDLLQWEQTLDYSMPREQIAKVFGEDNVLFFSGKESKKVKDAAVDTFNDDNSGKNLLVIQEASGKEGISLHDTTGNHQRVVITLALPQSPITALQIEGRIYRIGNMSNAIFEYPILGLNSEMMLFGQKFNNQVSTTENLALGSQARNLRDSFAKGILEHSGIIPIDQQGVGGKAFDAPKQEGDSDPFDDAVLDYYSNQKLNKKNREGVDYFPTPEPLGYKMVQWAGLGEGDSVLEPSAGHGAIARYVPQSNELVSIEPSQNLFSRLQLKVGGFGRKFLNNIFENYDIHNKHDAVIMNPPFGKSGATAIQHLDKAFKHLDEGGRVVALIPRGATDKKFDAWLSQNKDAVMRAEVNLPDITFQQAGTSVMSRVVVLDKVTSLSMREKAGSPDKIDLSGHYDKVEDFFEDLRNIEMPDRIIDTNFKMQKKSRQTAKDIKDIKGVRKVELDKHGITVKISGDYLQYGMTFDNMENPKLLKDNMASYYKMYDKMGQKAGYDDTQKAVFDELKKLSCKLAGMTEEEMQRYIKSGGSDGTTHFREERGVQYSKTDEKDVKNSRIIPEDVDKSVSSQIEKKFDDEISSVYGGELTPEERNEVERIANLYRNTPIHDEYSKDENGNKRSHGGLESAIKTWERLATEVEDYYGIERITRAKADGQGDGLNRGASGLRSEGWVDGMGRRTGDIPAEDFREYQRYLTNLASAKRALEYHNERTRVLEERYGVKRDEWLSQDTIEKIFKDFNSDKNLQTLFDRIKDQVKNLDVYFGEVYGSEKGLKGFYRHSYNDIRINLDSLSAFGKTKQDLASTILHEMLHPVTSDIIAMYQEGHTDKLTSSQIEAAKEAVDLFNEIKKTFKDNGWDEPYALTNAREFFAELSSPEWRAALKKIKNGDSWWKRAIKSIAKMLGFKTSTNKLDEAEKVLDNLLSNFGKEQFDYAARHANELFKDVQSKKVEDKDELDRLNKEKTFRMYSGMQELDGKLYSPMAAIIDGKRTDATEIGAWMAADERPDLVKNGKFTLVKTDKAKGAGEGDVPAAYNPYMHTSTSMMNDQFTGAYARGNIKVVEWEIPESEKTSGYRAEGAKDAVGMVPWHSGSVNSLLPKDRQRSVMLSRWRKAVRVVPDSEVAESIAQQLKGTGLAIPWNVVTPNQLRELAKIGVPITTVESGKQSPEVKAKFEAQMEDLKKEFPQSKFVDVKMTQSAFKEWGKNGGTHFREEDAVRISDDAPVVVKHVDKIAKKVGGKVKMIQSVGEITNKAAKEAIEAGKNITGWYDEKTGEVHLYMPNIHDRYTAEKTIWHEVVGHKGMRKLIGDDNYSDFLRGLWYDLDKPENARLKELVNEELKYNPFDFENGIEEGIARLVEDGKGEPGFWNNIKNKVTDLLHEIGYRVAPNTKDVKYLLWLAKNVQKHPNDLVWKMRAEAVRWKLANEDVPAMIEKDGVFYDNDGKARSFDELTKKDFETATDGEIHLRTTPSAATALDRYHKSLDAHGYMFTESYMDNMLSLKNLMQAIVPDNKNIADIKSSENPYILQNTMQGAMSNASQMFERNMMKPLDKAMAHLLDAFEGKKDKDKLKNFNLYMITKHGLERNRVLFVRDHINTLEKEEADNLREQWNAEKKDLGDKLRKGTIQLDEYYKEMDEWIRNNVDASYKADEHDYSGIHAIQGVESDSDPYNDADAIASVMDSESSMEGIKKGSVNDFWDKVKKATQYSLDSDYKNGLMDKELYGHVSQMFDWYVPLRKYDEKTAEDTYGYITEKGDPKNFIGKTIMRAKGRKSLSETNVLAQIGAMGNRAINNGGQNAIKQAFARFIRSHSDNNLVTETSVWYVDDPKTQTTTERYPEIPEDATPDEVNQIVKDFNMEMQELQAKGLASKVRRRGNIGYRFQKAENKSQHLVDVMIAGKKHTFVINGNPRAAQALNGLLEHKNTTFLGKAAATISRFMAQTCTSYNPEFVMRNMVRDFEFASSNLLAKEGFRYTTTFEKYYAQVGLIEGIRNTKMKDFKDTGGFGLFAKYRNGTLDTSDKIQRYFKEFMENGGETGWVQVKSMKDLTKEYKSHIKAERKGMVKVGKGIYDAIFKNLENANEIAENMARFATYCASRDYGRSIVRSTYDAKEVSTNFNRHGSGGEIKSFKNGEMGAFKNCRKNFYGFSSSYLRNCSMFFNAGIQSTNLLVKNLKTNPISTGAYIMAAPFVSGALMALVNNMIIAGEDEKDRKGVKDPYGELPDYIRKNNLCIYTGGGEFITIPLAIEERAFYGLGDLAAGMTFSPNIKTTRSWYAEGIGCASQLVPVLDYLGNKTVDKDPVAETLKATLPSATSPFVEWAFNSDWKGAPIERDNSFGKNQPAWMRAYHGTPEELINLNKWVNAQTNDIAKGNEDMLGNGFLDAMTNPSGIQHYYSGFLGGAATFVERTIGLIKNGKDTETKDIPFVRSLLYTPSEQTSLQRTKSKWYNYKDELETTMANVDRLKAKNVPIDKRLQNMADYYHFQNSSDAAKVRIIDLAEKQMKQWKKMRDRATDTQSVNFANQNIDRIMMEAVEELDRME